jgi:hypothetical protein
MEGRLVTKGWAAALAAICLAGCSTSGILEDKIAERLEQELGPAQRYDVTVSGLRRSAGEADHVQAVGYGIRSRRGPALDRMTIDIYNVGYDRDRKRLEHADSTRATVWISDRDLTQYLDSLENVASATVTVAAPDSATIRVRPSIAGIPLPGGTTATVTGRLEGDGPYLRFEVSEVGAGGMRASEGVTRRISQIINPLVDLSYLPFGLSVTNVSVQGRTVRIDAKGEAPALAY